MNIAELLDVAISRNASDVHLSTGSVPMLRVNGQMQPLDFPAPDEAQMRALLLEMMSEEQRKKFEAQMDIDFAYTSGGVRFRVNAFCQMRGPGAVFRSIPNEIPTLEDLPAPEIIYRLLGLSNGLVLLTGPTGSGKSTTQAAMLRYINETARKHIITLEDPIEFVHTNDFSLITQRQIHEHTRSFSTALRAALREDPDIILVGEMRDLETIRLALTAAETGHLVIATLHTSSASKAVNRIIDVFPSEEKDLIRSLISESLHAVILQTLVERKSGGRIAAFEVMLGTPAVRNLIRNDKVEQLNSYIQTSKDQGMISLSRSIEELVEQGEVDAEVARKIIASHTGF